MKYDKKTLIWGILSFVCISCYSLMPILGTPASSSEENPACVLLSTFFYSLVFFAFFFPTFLSLLSLSRSSNQYKNSIFVLIWIIQALAPVAFYTTNYAEDLNMSFRLWYSLFLLCLVVILESLLLLTKRRSFLRNMWVLGFNVVQLCFWLPLPE